MEVRGIAAARQLCCGLERGIGEKMAIYVIYESPDEILITTKEDEEEFRIHFFHNEDLDIQRNENEYLRFECVADLESRFKFISLG